MQPISRRKFLALTATGVAAIPLNGSSRHSDNQITAEQVVERVKTKVGIEWATETVDTFKAGGPKTIVTGIITTPLVSLDAWKPR